MQFAKPTLFARRLAGLFMSVTLFACGGGGGSSGSVVGPTPGPGQSTSGKVNLIATPTTLQSGGGNASIVATVRNAADAALPGQAITFAVDSGSLQNPPTLTDPSGTATATLSVGTDRSNRVITVTVTSGTASNVISVPVVGTKLELTGTSTVPLNGADASFTVRALDSAGAPVAAATLNVSSALGNTLGSPTVVTDSAGFAQISYVATRSGVDTLTVVGLGASVQTQVTINGASKIDLSASGDSVPTAGGPITITAVVKNASNSALIGQAVTFSASSGSLIGAQAVTDASGAATVRLNAGADRSNRVIVVTATAGGARSVLNVPVSGTKLFLSGSGSLLSAAGATNYSVRAQDSAGGPINGAVVSITSALGNPISMATVTTDSVGFAQFSYTPAKQGFDTLSVSGLGVVAQLSVSVTGQDFAFVSPATGTSLTTGVAQDVQVRLLNGSAGAAGRTISFSTTRGTVNPTTAVTNAAGVATVSISSTTAGPAILTAVSDSGESATQSTEFVAVTPASVALQVNPTAVLPNAPGTNTNRATLLAVVRDAIGNPVKNTTVAFSAVDPSGGTVTPATATTDANGQAVSSFIPGAVTTGSNAVVVTASVAGNTAITSSSRLTVSGQALFVSIGTGNELIVVNTTTYSKPFTVYVTDSNGSAVRAQNVVLSLFVDTYTKGRYVASGGKWVATPSVSCVNEDANRDGVLSVGEDTNRDGSLTPGGVAVIAPTSVTTDDAGFASFNVLYGKQFGSWANTTIRASAQVAGTESSAAYRFGLAVLAADVASTDISPPGGVDSPFGVGSSCTSAQ